MPRLTFAVPRLYAIADLDTLGTELLPDAVTALADAGVGWIQLRAKRATDLELYRLAEDCVRGVEGTSAALWIDDRPDVAALFPVFGVHVGQSDLPPWATRRVVGAEVRIGRSTHDAAELVEADGDPDVDIIALGPIYATKSKETPEPVVGVERLRELRGRTSKPLVAIGGIDGARALEVLEAGADSVVMLGAVSGASAGEVGRRAGEMLRVVG